MKNTNLVLDFTGVYAKDTFDFKDFDYIDCTDITGADMYCDKNAEDEIKKRLEKYGASGVHFLDSGNYHYVTKFFLDKIKSPFSLVLFDYHSDMQQPMIHELTSCGSWAGDVLRNNKYLEQLIIIGPDEKNFETIPQELRNKVICISIQELEKDNADKNIFRINWKIPFYISIDKDVLSRSYAVTNWNQGKMSVDMLEKPLTLFLAAGDVMGVDICGEDSISGESMAEYIRARHINEDTNRQLYKYIQSFF